MLGWSPLIEWKMLMRARHGLPLLIALAVSSLGAQASTASASGAIASPVPTHYLIELKVDRVSAQGDHSPLFQAVAPAKSDRAVAMRQGVQETYLIACVSHGVAVECPDATTTKAVNLSLTIHPTAGSSREVVLDVASSTQNRMPLSLSARQTVALNAPVVIATGWDAGQALVYTAQVIAVPTSVAVR